MAADAGDRFPHVDRKRAALALAVAGVLAVGAVALVGRVADFGRMLDALGRVDARWFALAAAGQLVKSGAYVVGYRAVARVAGGPLLTLWMTARSVFLGYGAYAVGSAAGGMAVEFWTLHRASGEAHDSARRVLALNTLKWGVLGAAATVAGALVLMGIGGEAPVEMALAWLVAVPVFVVAALWIASPRWAPKLVALRCDAPDERGRSLRLWLEWAGAVARNGLADVVGALVFVRRIVTKPRPCSAALSGLVFYWAGDVATLYGAVRAFPGAELGAAELVLAYATGYVAIALPLPGGGAGAVEASLAATLSLVGIPLASALLASVAYRVFTFWLPIPLALAAVPTARSLAEDLPRARRE